MKKKVKLLITVTALAAVLLVTLASCGQLANGDEKEVSVNLPYLSRNARALSDDVNSRLKNEHSSYRVHMNDRVLEGTGGNFSASFAVGLNVEVFVESLNSNGEVIVRTVTKSIVVKDGENSVDFDIKQDGEEVIQTRSPSVKYDGGAADAIGVPIDTTTYSSGSAVPLSAQEPTRPGFIFMGWISNVDLTGTNDSGSEKINQGIPFAKVGTSAQGIDFPINTFEMPASPVTLTAKWEVNYKYDKADWKVGDIVLQDTNGNIVAVHKDVYNIRDTAYGDGVAVVYKNANNKVYIVGKVHEKNELVWCDSSAAGYNQNFTSLQCEPDNGGTAGNYTFTGKQASGEQHTDGSTNWQKLKDELAGNDDTDPPGKYPAWEWVNDYAKTQGLTGDLATGWYLPTFAELFDIWKANRTDGGAIENSLTAAGGDTFGSDTYWSSSLYASSGNRAYDLYFSTGDRLYSTKGMKYYVCAVRQLQY